MKVLCFSDLHCDRASARSIVDQSKDADLVVGAGDFANQHRGLADTLDILCEITQPSFLVPGNGETLEELLEASANWESATVLHGSGLTVEMGSTSLPVFGVGGGIPVTPFGAWSYDFDEESAIDLLSDCPASGLLIVHSPPIETVDHDSSDRVRGSQSIRECVERCQPKLVVCGHIHSDWGKQVRLGESLVVNAGPQGVMIDLD